MPPNQILIGASTTDISPKKALPLAGRGGPLRVGTPIPKRLEANAIVVEDEGKRIAIVAIDTLFCSQAMLNSVKQKVNIELSIDHFFLIASHTHNAPSLDPGKPYLGPVEADYFEFATETIAKCIIDAQRHRAASSRISRGESQCFANARRRRKSPRVVKKFPFVVYETFTLPVHAADVPRSFSLVVSYDAQGRPQWVMWSWPCHPTAFPQSTEVHGDFPAELRQHIRDYFKSQELPVLFTPGLMGDLRSDASPHPVPLWKQLVTPFARPFAQATDENFRILNQKLATSFEDAALHLVNLNHGTFFLNCSTVSVPLSRLMTNTTHKGIIELSVVQFGPLSFLFVGSEMCSPWAAVIAPLLPIKTMISGYCNDVPCYLPTNAQISEGGYEVSGFRTSFAVDGHYKPDVETDILAALKGLELHHLF